MVATLAALVLVAGVGVLLHGRGTPAAPSRQGLADIAAPAGPALAMPAVPQPTPSEASVVTESPSSPAAVVRSKAASAARRSLSRGAGHARVASEGRRRPGVDAEADSARCKPPYYFNAQGIRVFKIECL